MADAFQYDVFLSHNQADRPRAQRLAVWFDEWIIQPGDGIYLTMERGLEANRGKCVYCGTAKETEPPPCGKP